MTQTQRIPRLVLFLATAGHVACWSADSSALEPRGASRTAEPAPAVTKPKYRTESLRGKVVWLADALNERYGIETDADAARAQVALDSDDGTLYPIVKDSRGRAFHLDERLRGVELELLVRRFDGSPLVQVVRVYSLKPEGKYELDYWCDVCAIPMYELKECECCQGPIRIRERLVEQEAPAQRSKAADGTKRDDRTKEKKGTKP
jgi:hypothetical protein